MKPVYIMVDVLLNREVIATSKAPCNPQSEGFKKGLAMLAEKHGVSICKLTWRRHREETPKKTRGEYAMEYMEQNGLVK